MQDARLQAAGAAGGVSVVTQRPEPGLAVLLLDRPGARNSLSLEMIAALDAAVAACASDAAVKVVVIAAEGPAFCAGHDLKELTGHRDDSDGGAAFYAETMRACAAMMLGIVACPKPVIAAVEGVATAAGCQLVATCDLAIAGGNARFCTPGVDIGLFCSTPMVALTRNVPRKRAMQMLMTGEIVGAADAAQWGLVNEVVATGSALTAALALARRIASKSPATLAIGKKAFYAQIDMPLAEAYAYAADVMVKNMMLRDAEEGIGAFIAKRPPQWTGC